MVDGVDEVDLLLSLDGVGGLDTFEPSVCLICPVEGKEGAARLAVSEDRNFEVPIIQELTEEESVLQGWVSSLSKGVFRSG